MDIYQTVSKARPKNIWLEVAQKMRSRGSNKTAKQCKER